MPALGGGTLSAATGTQQPELTGQVRGLLNRASTGPMHNVWERALDIVDLEGSGDALAAAVKTAAAEATPRGKLAAARALRLIASGDL